MSSRKYCRPFKFVVVGEMESGKTRLVKKFISGGATIDEKESDLPYQATSVCDGFKLLLKAKISQKQESGSFLPLTQDDIDARLGRKFMFSSAPSSPATGSRTTESDFSWDKIKVDLRELEVKWPREDKKLLGKKVLKRPQVEVHLRAKEGSHSSTPNLRRRDRRGLVFPANFSPINIPRNIAEGCVVPPPPSSDPTLTPEAPKETTLDIELDLWDTGGDKRFTWYRWYACTGADVVLLCVPLASIMTFTGEHDSRRKPKISKELQKFMSDELLSTRTRSEKSKYRIPPVLLVGTKSDLYLEKTTPSESNNAGFPMIEQIRNQLVDAVGIKLAIEADCCDFIPCSIVDGSNLNEVFETALAISLTTEDMYRASVEREHEPQTEHVREQEPSSPTYFRIHSTVREEKKNSVSDTDGDENVNSTKDLKTSSTRKPKPSLFFPPPPNSSPPSTRPPSSDFSLPGSGMSSSLESLIDSNSERPESTFDSVDIIPSTYEDITPEVVMPTPEVTTEGRKVTNDVTVTSQEEENNDVFAEPKAPVPSPRRSIASRNKSYSSTSSVTSDQREEGRLPPTPKPRTQRPMSPRQRPRARLPSDKRMTEVFVKFLKS